jgi:hypothetical protein
VNLKDLWREHRASPEPGVAALTDFALRLFSAVPNSAAVERLFSLFGILHTKHKNRLDAQKVRKSAIVRADTAKTYGALRTTRRKRQFGDCGSTDIIPTPRPPPVPAAVAAASTSGATSAARAPVPYVLLVLRPVRSSHTNP